MTKAERTLAACKAQAALAQDFGQRANDLFERMGALAPNGPEKRALIREMEQAVRTARRESARAAQE